MNGGLNTVMDALAAGVPLAVVPIAFEQAAIAARVARAGAGRRLSRRLLTVGATMRALRDLTEAPAYRSAAGGLRDEISQAGGVGAAADVVEAVLQTRRPVTRSGLAAFRAGRGPLHPSRTPEAA